MKKDLFGYQTQGKKYDIYRPRYPLQMLNKSVKKAKGRNRYLDIATGTGQILFELYKDFKHSEGLDLSQNMLKKQISGIELKCENFIQSKITNKYDLITIGQALHWIPIREFLQKCSNSLNQGGVLGIYGYVLHRAQAQNQQQSEKISKLFEQFYDKKVKKNFDFDRDQVHTHYSNKERYPFHQIFPDVQHEILPVAVQMDKNGFISYLKTYSGYNTYLQKYPKEEDPILPLVRQIPQGIKIKGIFDYFCYICRNQKN